MRRFSETAAFSHLPNLKVPQSRGANARSMPLPGAEIAAKPWS
jgi:hypothetical protein